MMRRIAASIAFTAASLASGHASCGDLLPQATETRQHARAIEARDLVTLRDIGQPGDRVDLESPLGLSPDGRHAAFVLRRADPDANGYCQGLVVLDLQIGRPKLVDQGGDLIRDRYALFGHALPESGVPRVIVPRWSPDGRYIAYLKRTGPAAQIWLAAADGSGARALTDAEAGVESFAWTADGTRLVFSSRTGEIAAKAAIAREALRGYLVDARFRPISARHPFPREADVATSIFSIDAVTGDARPTSDVERTLLARIPASLPAETIAAATGPDGRLAWIMREGALLSRRLTARIAGTEHGCRACSGEIVDLWWSNTGPLFFLKREGASRQTLSLYRWSPAEPGDARRLLGTGDLLIGCRPMAEGDLVCLREASLAPRHVVRVDGATGRSTPLWEPNPGFARLDKPRVERLYWTNANGIETFGDLVLPMKATDAPYPLVIVQYGSRGFLRGGTGDEYPILAFAARGHAVLSFQRPLHLALLPPADPRAQDAGEHAERRNVQSSLERGIADVLAKGMIDQRRIGITGLSDGATTTAWALINDRRFAAAAISTCCADPALLPLLGEAQIEAYGAEGFPKPGEAATDFWSPIALSTNAAHITTPILMNLSDDEFLGALSPYWALRAAGKPVEMHVFPGEHHIKFQPAHRLAIYERNLQWFDFWLKDREDPSASLRSQYQRWRGLASPGSRGRASGLQLQLRTQASVSTKARMRWTSPRSAPPSSSDPAIAARSSRPRCASSPPSSMSRIAGR